MLFKGAQCVVINFTGKNPKAPNETKQNPHNKPEYSGFLPYLSLTNMFVHI